MALSIGAYGYVKGDEHGSAKYHKLIASNAVEASRMAKVRTEITTKTVTKYIKIAGEQENVDAAIKKAVDEYARNNRSYTLDGTWRGLHDRAATGASKDGTVPSATVQQASGAPTAAEALSTVTENYAKANRNADRLDSLIEWVTKQTQVK